MSKTEDLDRTIEMLNEQLGKSKALKDRLSITDRLTRLYSLKLKYNDSGKGGKFSLPSQSPNGADNATGSPDTRQ